MPSNKAPKARNVIAQGNALGAKCEYDELPSRNKAPKGRNDTAQGDALGTDKRHESAEP